MSAELDEHTLATLSDEERAALAEHEEDLKTMAAEEAAGGDDDEPADEAKPATDPEPADEAQAQAQAQAQTDVAADVPADDAARPVVYTATLPADFDAKVEAVKAKVADAWADFDAGAMDRATLQQRVDEANAEALELNNAKVKADLAREMREQAEASEVPKAAAAVIKMGKAQGVDYEGDDSKWEDLRAFADQVERRNPGKGPEWVLGEAHKRVLALHGVTVVPAQNPTASPADAKKAALQARKQDLSAAPRDLAQVPGGDGPGDVAGEFADVLALDGDDYEAALARMTPAQRERFMQAV